MTASTDHDRLLDLLADRTLVGLEPTEDEELARLLVAFPDTEALAREIELAAAAIAIAAVSDRGLLQMPEGLLGKIEEGAQDGMPTTVHRIPDLAAAAAAAMRAKSEATSVAAVPNALKQTVQMHHSGSAPTAPPALGSPPAPTGMAPHATTHVVPFTHSPTPPPAAFQQPAFPQQPQPPQQQPSFQQQQPQQQQPHPSFAQQPAQVVPLRPRATPEKARSSGRGVAITGWLAAAACLLLAAGTWYLRPRTQIVTVTLPAPPPSVTASTAPPPAPASATAERESLLARAGTAKLEWAKTKDPASKQATGDVVWNATEQRGYMRFRGLARNDKRTNVYQLWIFDKSRDDKYPIDGGVFEIEDETGDVVVPIKARLPVGEVALFAVTVEKPGGVVVSKRERIVVTAKPAT